MNVSNPLLVVVWVHCTTDYFGSFQNCYTNYW